MTGKTERKRIFIAIDLSDDARSACADHIERLRREYQRTRIGWERAEKLHITLKFLGPTSDEALSGLLKSLKDFRDRGRMRLAGPGVFPNETRPRILWIGVDDIDSFAGRAQAAVEEICGPLGFEPEARKFTPHVTIGRVRDPNSAREATVAHLSAHIEPVEFEADRLVVYESKLLTTDSVYTVVARFPS